MDRTGRQAKLGKNQKAADEVFPSFPNLVEGGSSKLLN
jgi:hypothetical protein